MAKNPGARGRRKPSEPRGEAKIVPLEPSSPTDPRVSLPDAEREVLIEERPNGIVVTTYMDAPANVSLADARTINPPSFESLMGYSRTAMPAPKAPRGTHPWATLNDLEGRKL